MSIHCAPKTGWPVLGFGKEMASLESAFGEETMADINPSLDRESSAATGEKDLKR